MRVYQPSTLTELAAAHAAGSMRPDQDAVVSESEAEDDEYAALMTAADISTERLAGLADGLRRRVVVVLEVGGTEILAVHADPVDDVDPDDDLAWYASQEVDSLAERDRLTISAEWTPSPSRPRRSTSPTSPTPRAVLSGRRWRTSWPGSNGASTTFRAHINGRKRAGGGAEIHVVQPHDHQHVLGTIKGTTPRDAELAIRAALAAAPDWRAMSIDDRCAILLKAADLLAGPWRQRINAATMLGQSKTAFQAEIDSACELIDFWRFNVHYAKQIYTDQPIANSPGVWNRTDHRPLEGFVYAITPFNFTAIAGNLPTAPALMGNTVIWKPAPTQQLAASLTMELLEEAGMPPGVINMLPGHGLDVSKAALAHPDLAGIHFTGSTPTFQHLWRTIGENISSYRSYPRIVGETGGKDFIVAHPSADPDVAADRDDPRRVRVPGPEVLGRLACVRREVGVDEDQGRPGRRRPSRSRWATSPTSPTSWVR